MSHPSSDAVMDIQKACRHGIQFRLGLQFRNPYRPQASPEASLLARYLRIQAASPPPDRVDGSDWQEGFRVHDGSQQDGREFKASDASWKRSGVFPLGGTSSLDQPPPDTIVLDQWLAVPVVPPAAAITTTFTLTLPGMNRGGNANHFLSVPYSPRPVDGQVLPVVGATYSCEKALTWAKTPKGWVAVSLDRFWPPERESADYIVEIEDCTGPEAHLPDEAGRVPWQVNRWW